MYVTASARDVVAFDDLAEYEKKNCLFPTKIFIDYGEAIDRIGFGYENVNLAKHGETMGNPQKQTFDLLPGEHIIKITGLTSHYWNNEFIFSIKFHTVLGRVLGIDNQNDRIPFGQEFTITFDEGYALACIFGEVASPTELGQGVLKGNKFLSAIGAYQREIPNAAFTVYAQQVEIPVLSSYMDHTGVNALYGEEKYQFGCFGELAKNDAKFINAGTGSLTEAIIITTGKIPERREDNIYKSNDDVCGIIYLVDGVCHQMANRIISVTGNVMPVAEVAFAKYSHMLYGIYGNRWEQWKEKCYNIFGTVTRRLLAMSEEKPKILSVNIPGISFDYALTEKLLEIESQNLSAEEALKQRIKVVLQHKNDVTDEQINEVVEAISKTQKENVQRKTLASSENLNDEAKYRLLANQAKADFEKINKIIGDAKFSKVFDKSFEDIKNELE